MDVYIKERLGSHLRQLGASSSSSHCSCHLLASPALSSNHFVPTTSVTLTIIPSLARLHHFFITSSYLHHLIVAKPFFSYSPHLSSSLLSHYLCLFSLTSLSAHSCLITLITSSLPPLPRTLSGRCCIRSLVALLPRSMTPRPRPLVPYGLIKAAASLTRR